MKEEVEQYLREHNIHYVNHEHEPVFTSQIAEKVCKDIPGVHCKNLFLKAKKTGKLYLYTLPSTQRADLKALAKKVGVKHFSLGSAELLRQILHVEPGSVSPLTLIYESAKDVVFLIDKQVWEADIVGFHPNENTATLEMTREEFHKLVEMFCQETVIV
ncbi:prolyl-tRNA synthetase associated domain-containing protein [Candidatus Woesearchaeota archaeon]|nr:MAG: prolyl-tRNA synthetase associated domain-containing protein [Candidatus Woesearchaeota archaeon]